MKTNNVRATEMAFNIVMDLIDEAATVRKEKGTTKLQKAALDLVIPRLAEVAGTFQLEALNAAMKQHEEKVKNENKKPNKKK